MSINTPEELERMRAAGAVVRRVIEAMTRQLRPGVTTAELDKIGAAVMPVGALTGVRVPWGELHQHQ